MPLIARASSIGTSSPRTFSSLRGAGEGPGLWLGQADAEAAEGKAAVAVRSAATATPQAESISPARAWRWARSPTCRRSRRGEKNSTPARTSSVLARCSTRWPRASQPFTGNTSAGFSKPSYARPRPRRVRLNPELPGGAGTNHQQGAGERPRAALPERRRHARRPEAPEARYGIRACRGGLVPAPNGAHEARPYENAGRFLFPPP